jgi:hypothetical protein
MARCPLLPSGIASIVALGSGDRTGRILERPAEWEIGTPAAPDAASSPKVLLGGGPSDYPRFGEFASPTAANSTYLVKPSIGALPQAPFSPLRVILLLTPLSQAPFSPLRGTLLLAPPWPCRPLPIHEIGHAAWPGERRAPLGGLFSCHHISLHQRAFSMRLDAKKRERPHRGATDRRALQGCLPAPSASERLGCATKVVEEYGI